MGMEVICVDAGSSETRIFSFGSNKVSVHNNAVWINVPQELNTEDFINKTAGLNGSSFDSENIIDIMIRKLDGSISGSIEKFVNRRILAGKLAETLSSKYKRLTSLKPKREQPEYYINTLVAIMLDQIACNRDYYDVKLNILIPPAEYISFKDSVINLMAGEYEITHNLNKQKYRIRMDKKNISIFPECYSSFANICFNDVGKKTDLGQRLVNRRVMVIDIGKSTSDQAGIDNMKALGYTFYSFPFGCDYIINTLIALIAEKFGGYRPSYQIAEEAQRTGLLQDGNSLIEIYDIVNKARKTFADKYIQEFLNYLDIKDIHPKSIGYLLFTGGGALADEGKLTTSAASMVYEGFREYSTNTQGVFVEEPRLSNIKGLVKFIKATS